MRRCSRWILFILLIWTVSGCQQAESGGENPPADAEATLWITQQYGSESLKEKKVALTGEPTVMELLQSAADVETAYGGGFVNAIEGLKSKYTGMKNKKKNDWFYWVNGINAHVGAADMLVRPGDVIWWDYHNWDHTLLIPAAVGAFPQPFTGGYDGVNDGTRIWFSPESKRFADRLQSLLQSEGAPSVEREPFQDQDIFNRDRITMIVGTWPALKTHEGLKKWLRNGDRAGAFVRIRDGELQALRTDGTVETSYAENAALIISTATGAGDPHPLWLVLGMDEKGLKQAVEILINEREKIRRKAGVIVHHGEVAALPRP